MSAVFIDSGPGVIASLIDLASVDQRALIAGLDVPLLSIVGGADPILDPQIGVAAATLARRGTAVIFEDCGHAPFIEDAPRYTAVLRDFMAAL